MALREAKAIVEDRGAKASDAQRYGLALAQMRSVTRPRQRASAGLVKAHPGNLWVGLALAENASVAKNEALSRKRFEELLAQHPG